VLRQFSMSAQSRKTVALALGGGGARSLAQIPVLEALDEIGVKPVAIAGVSFGAVIAAAYCSGMSGKAIRRAVIALAHDRAGVFSRLLAARAAGLSDWLSTPFGNPFLLDAEKFCDRFLPAELPDDFAGLQIPLTVIATDLHGRGEAALADGALKSAVAASIAIPGLMRPVERDGRVLVDGAAVNPLPFDHLRGRADIVIAVDAAVGPGNAGAVPDPWEALAATMAVIGQGLVAQKLAGGAPDLLLRPNVRVFRLFDFFRASAILRAADPIKTEVRDGLARIAKF
jgi:NTE family protein